MSTPSLSASPPLVPHVPAAWACVLVAELLTLSGCSGSVAGPQDDQTAAEVSNDQGTCKDMQRDICNARPDDALERGADSSDRDPLRFPEGFLWGVATSAFQTEGGTDNDFDRWIEQGKAPGIGLAADSFHRYSEDIALAQGLGVQVYRLSIEWSRIEPEQDVIDQEALEHYRDVVQAVRDAGMEPAVTLHHFTNPVWFAEQGGWGAATAAEEFVEYAAVVGEALQDLVDLWNPMNEPMIYISGHALVSIFPNGGFYDLEMFGREFRQMAFGHAGAGKMLRQVDALDADGDGLTTQILAVTAVIPAHPAEPDDPAHVKAAKGYGYMDNHAFLRAIVDGDLDLDLDGAIGGELEGVAEGHFDELAGSVDLMGVNYYSRTFVFPMPDMIAGGMGCIDFLECGHPNDLQGDNGNEVYPPGMYEAIAEMSVYGLPLVVTENGVADADDDLRPSYIVMHLLQVLRAIEDGYDVRGYWHWSLLDNYEWLSGFTMKFGLFSVDFDTLGRSARPDSVPLYRDIVSGNGLTPEMVAAWDIPTLNPR